MKRAVVLSGGGTKGAYEFGVWKALRELNVDYQIVTGTSIGSINGAMMVTGDYDQCDEMWQHLVMEDMMVDGITVTNTIEDFYNNKKPLGPYLKKYLKRGGVDNSPFTDFVHKNVSEHRIRESRIDYGLVTVKLKGMSMIPFMLHKDQIPAGLLKDYVIASSSVFPVFPAHKIGEDSYLDGCYCDNLPIDLAISMGATDVIAVDLHVQPQHPNYTKRPYVTYLTPSRDLGGILDFDQERIRRNERMGYRDAMRRFGRLKGFTYNFTTDSMKKYRRAAERLSYAVALAESTIMQHVPSKLEKATDLYRMFQIFEEHTAGKELKKEDYFIRAAEVTADIFGMEADTVYDMSDFVAQLKGKLKGPEAYPDAALFTNESNRAVFKRLSDLKIADESEYLTGCIYYALRANTIKYEERCSVLTYMPHEMAAAIFLSTI